MLMPGPSCILEPIDILHEFEEIVSRLSDAETLGNAHVDILSQVSLGICQYKVH